MTEAVAEAIEKSKQMYRETEQAWLGERQFPSDLCLETLLHSFVMSEIWKLDIGETFQLRDIFKGYVWNRLSQAQKAELGRMLSDYVYEYMPEHWGKYLSYEGKTKQKQMVFKIIGEDDVLKIPPRTVKKLDMGDAPSYEDNPQGHKDAFYWKINELRSKRGKQ